MSIITDSFFITATSKNEAIKNVFERYFSKDSKEMLKSVKSIDEEFHIDHPKSKGKVIVDLLSGNTYRVGLNLT